MCISAPAAQGLRDLCWIARTSAEPSRDSAFTLLATTNACQIQKVAGSSFSLRRRERITWFLLDIDWQVKKHKITSLFTDPLPMWIIFSGFFRKKKELFCPHSLPEHLRAAASDNRGVHRRLSGTGPLLSADNLREPARRSGTLSLHIILPRGQNQFTNLHNLSRKWQMQNRALGPRVFSRV